jgi:hypothetical protein
MSNSDSKKLGQNEFFKCPLPHPHPRQEQAYFKSFDSHFSTFSSRDDHMAVLQLHEELNWKARCVEAEKWNLTESDMQRISQRTWMDAVKKQTGKSVQIVIRK